MSFRAKLAFWGVVLGLMVAGFVWLVIRAPRKVPLVALQVTNYDLDLIPPNAWAAEDLERFAGQFAGEHSNVEPQSLVWKTTQSDEPLKELGEALAGAYSGGPDKNVILIYLSAHGVVNSANEPCLLQASSDPVDESSWLKMSDVLREIGKHPAEKKLLVLDCNRMLANWSCGQLYNHFADRLKDAVARHGDKNLVVLNSTSPAESLKGPCEVGWEAPELGGTAFGYFFLQGLRGAADQGDGQVDLRELAAYLERKVGDWTVKNRVGRQRPCLMPDGAQDFPLAYCEEDSGNYQQQEPKRLQKAKLSWEEKNRDWTSIEELWQDHDRLREAHVYRYDPRGFCQFERELLRLEQLMLGGSAYETARGKLIASAKGTCDRLKNVAAFDLSGCNLPMSERQHSSVDDAPNDAATAAPNEAPKDAPPGGEAASLVPYRVASRRLWNQLKQGPGSKKAIHEALAKLDAQKHEPAFDVVEVQFLRMLDRYVDDDARSLDLAVESRDLAETAATPADERAHYWLIEGINDADADRRAAEDLLFVGQPTVFPQGFAPPAAGPTLWQQANSKYESAKLLAEEVQAALDLRDRGLAEAPYLVEWLWLEKIGPRGLTPAIDPARINAHWTDLQGTTIVELHALSKELDESLAKRGQDDGWKAPRDAVQTGLDALHATLDECYQSLAEEEAPHQERVVRAERLLAIPTLTADQRDRVRERQHETLVINHAEAMRLVRKEYAHHLSDVERREDSKNQDQASAITANDVAAHPIMTLLADLELPGERSVAVTSDAAGEAPLGDVQRMFALQGGNLRKRLTKAGEIASKLMGPSSEKLASSESEAGRVQIGEIRGGYSSADRVQRATAAIYWPDDKIDPTARLCALDLHQVMVFQCQRTMEDFWGPKRPGDEPYFQTVARDCLTKAEGLCDSAEGLRKESRERLGKLEAAGRRPLVFGADKPLEVSRGEDQQLTPLQLTATQLDGVPQGLAAASINQDPVEPLKVKPDSGESLKRIGFPVGSDAAAKKFVPPSVYLMPKADWLSSGLEPSGPEAVAFYRGHVHRQRLPVNRQGVPIEYTPVELIAPTILVSGEETVPTSVMFIFDCSNSMQKQDVNTGQTRFEAARDILQTLLERLKASKFQVGLCLYGHRLYYEVDPATGGLIRDANDATGYKTRQSEFGKKANPKNRVLFPGSDREIVLHVGRFAEVEFQFVRQLLFNADLKQHGMTPLYLSIRDSVTDLDARSGETVKRIVAITDGINNQDAPTPGGDRVLASDLERMFAARRDIRVDIVGIGKEFDEAINRAEVDRMRRIAEMTGGEFFSTANADELLKHLEKSLRPAEFEVEGGGSPRQGPKDLNQTLTIEPVPKVKSPYDVEVIGIEPVATAKVVLEGGEAIQLNLRTTATTATLEHNRYTDNLFEELKAVSDRPGVLSGSGTFFVASHTPDAPGGRSWVEFRISIQNADERQFSPRPAETWVDITPVREDGTVTDTIYRFCDTNFVPYRPVPVVSCKAPEFPVSECRKAKIELFFKMQKTDPELKVPLARLTSGNSVPLESAGVRLHAEELSNTADGGRRVIVHETPVEGGARSYQIGRLKVEMQSPATRAQVFHDYSGGRHLFVFPSGTNLQQCEVLVTTRDKLENEAYPYTLGEQIVPR